MITNNGMEARLQRPLDFLVVADHSENMGLLQALKRADPLLLNTTVGQWWYEKYQARADKLFP